MASASRALYIGVTGNLERRVFQHRTRVVPGFTRRYNVVQLVWSELVTNINEALAAEKRMKKWRRNKKIALIKRRTRSGVTWPPTGSMTGCSSLWLVSCRVSLMPRRRCRQPHVISSQHAKGRPPSRKQACLPVGRRGEIPYDEAVALERDFRCRNARGISRVARNDKLATTPRA